MPEYVGANNAAVCCSRFLSGVSLGDVKMSSKRDQECWLHGFIENITSST